MSRIYEMCNDIKSEDLLRDREQISPEERRKLLDGLRREGVLSGNRKERSGNKFGRTAGWAAAAAALMLVIVPNISVEAANAMEQLPVLGSVIRVVTIRNYQYESEQFSADIEEVKLEQGGRPGDNGPDGTGAEDGQMNGVGAENGRPDGTSAEDGQTNGAGAENGRPGGTGAEDGRPDGIGAQDDKMEGSIQTINESIEEMTDRLIARFEEQAELGEGHSGIYAGHKVVTDTDTWFTLRIDVTEIAGSGFQYQYYYHIDKTTGEIVSLGDLFKEGADYITPVSENIKEQMRAGMKADESKIYWVDSKEEPGHQFEAVKEDQNFYLNEKGQIVICFDEYEVAPGYMGLVEFTVDEEAVADIRK